MTEQEKKEVSEKIKQIIWDWAIRKTYQAMDEKSA